MDRQGLIRDMKQSTGSSFITVTELCKYLGQANNTRVKNRYLRGLERVGKMYYIPDVAGRILEERRVGS